MSDPAPEQPLGEAFIALAGSLVAEYDLLEFLHQLADVSLELFDAAAAGLVLSDGQGRLDVLASTSERAELLEVLQIRTGRGPCMECYRTGRPGSIIDLVDEAAHWPEFAPLALEQGFRSVHAVPMRSRNTTIGALNLFRHQPGELAEADRRAAQSLADLGTIAILQQRALQESNELQQKLEIALNSRVVIEQAKGIVAHQGSMDMDAAFTALRSYAKDQHISLTVLARRLVNRDDSAALIVRAATGGDSHSHDHGADHPR